MLRILFFAIFLLPGLVQAQCPAGQRAVRLEIDPDQYWSEVSWQLTDLSGTAIYASGAPTSSSFQVYDYCVPADACAVFRLADTYGDGMAPDGVFRLYIDNVLAYENIGENYGHLKTVTFACAPGSFCTDPLPLTLGQHTTPGSADAWYVFTPDTTGTYRINTCALGNACASKIWVYDQCEASMVHDNNLGTLFYADGGCAPGEIGASAELYLAAGETYFIRIGYSAGNCNQTPLNFTVEYVGPVVGCTDPSACNYQPLATVSGNCIYPGDPGCDDLPDLVVDQQLLRTSLSPDVLINTDDCPVEEGCLRGYGTRHLLSFSTRIDNIGTADYNIGFVPNSPNTPSTQFVWDPCHNHWHYRGYAEYVVFDAAGTRLPLGSKNGFCVLDLSCPFGIPGKYTCGNMGISAGCADIYGSGIACQWVDVTDLAEGTYTLAVRVNWDKSPDNTGRHELSYTNNWAQACFVLEYAPDGQPEFDFIDNCPVYTDCFGEPYGDAQPDCNGVCAGPALRGDWNSDTVRTAADVNAYLAASLDGSGEPSLCNDLFTDNVVDVYDAALLQECVLYADDPAHWGTRFACQFPTGLANPDDIAYLMPGALDPAAKTFDVQIVNPYSKVLGFEFNVGGLAIDSVENLDPSFGATWQFDAASGKLLALSATEQPLNKNILPTAFLRIHYSELTDTAVCISAIQALVNDKYERTSALIADPGCVMLVTTGAGDPAATRFGAYAIPNPASDRVTVFFPNPASTPFEVTFTDAMGRVVRRFDGLRSESVTLERGTLPAGMYFFRVEGEMGQATGRVVFK